MVNTYKYNENFTYNEIDEFLKNNIQWNAGKQIIVSEFDSYKVLSGIVLK